MATLLVFTLGLSLETIIWLAPVSILTFGIKAIFKRKLSKGWCMIIWFLSVLASGSIFGVIINYASNGHPNPDDIGFSFFGYFFLFIIWLIIKNVLYDKELPSFFDSEEEVIRKYKKKKAIAKEDNLK